MAESHILLLPKANYFKWVKATQNYVLVYGVNITPDPPRAGKKQNITVAVVPNGFPEQGDIVQWLNTHFPNIKIDSINVNTPEELQAQLQNRINTKQRYGSQIVSGATSTTTTTTVVPSLPGDKLYLFWPSDYSTISQGFGANPEIYGKWGLPGHEGLDIRAPMNTNVYACADGEVFKVENNPDLHPYGKHIRIRHTNGYRTVYAHLIEVLVSEGQNVKAKQLIGKADSTGNSTGSHLHLTLKKDGATSRGETNYKGDVIDPTPYMVYPHQEAELLAGASQPQISYPWTQPCLVGLNVRDDGTMHDIDYEVVKAARLEAVKIQENSGTEIVAKLRIANPKIFIMARIAYDLGRVNVSPQEWVTKMKSQIDRLYNLDIRYFEIHQSPNLSAHGWNYSWHSGGGFARWWLDIVSQLRAPYPQARFGFPGVSPGGQVEGQRLDANTFIEQADEAIRAADWVGVNCFWMSEMEMGLENKGAFYNYMRQRFPDKLIFITEFANVNELTNLYVKGSEYMKFYDTIRNIPGFAGAFSQVMSSANAFGYMRWRTEEGQLTQIPYRVGKRTF